MLVYQRVLHQQPELLMPGRLRMFPLAWYIRTKGLLARMKPNTTPAGLRSLGPGTGIGFWMEEFGDGDGSKPWYLVNPKIAGKWMFIPLKIGINRYWSIPIWVWGKGIKAPKMNGATVQLVRYKYYKKMVWVHCVLLTHTIPVWGTAFLWVHTCVDLHTTRR